MLLFLSLPINMPAAQTYGMCISDGKVMQQTTKGHLLWEEEMVPGNCEADLWCPWSWVDPSLPPDYLRNLPALPEFLFLYSNHLLKLSISFITFCYNVLNIFFRIPWYFIYFVDVDAATVKVISSPLHFLQDYCWHIWKLLVFHLLINFYHLKKFILTTFLRRLSRIHSYHLDTMTILSSLPKQ